MLNDPTNLEAGGGGEAFRELLFRTKTGNSDEYVLNEAEFSAGVPIDLKQFLERKSKF